MKPEPFATPRAFRSKCTSCSNYKKKLESCCINKSSTDGASTFLVYFKLEKGAEEPESCSDYRG